MDVLIHLHLLDLQVVFQPWTLLEQLLVHLDVVLVKDVATSRCCLGQEALLVRVLVMSVRLSEVIVLRILLSRWESVEKLMMWWAILRMLVRDDGLDAVPLVLINRGCRCGGIGNYPLQFQQLLLLVGSER
jgi:hypothetical protein